MTHLDDGADLRAVMDRSLHDLAAPAHCGPAAVASGRRIRRRRRAMGAVSGVAACAAVTAVFAIPALGDGGGTAPSGPAASDVTTPTPSPTPTPSDAETPSKGPDQVPSPGADGPAGWWDVPSTQMVDALKSTLPEGVTVTRADTTTEGPDGPSPGVGGLSGILTAETGPGSFQLLLYAPEGSATAVERTTDAEGNLDTRLTPTPTSFASRLKCRDHHESCVPIRDGGDLVGRASVSLEHGTTLYEVFLLRADGGALNFTVMDSSGEKPGYEDPSGEVPPLTLDQLRALAEDPVWTSYRP